MIAACTSQLHSFPIGAVARKGMGGGRSFRRGTAARKKTVARANTLTGSSFNSPFYDRLHTPLVRQYNLGIQYEFIPSYVLEFAFVDRAASTSPTTTTTSTWHLWPARKSPSPALPPTR